MPLENDNRTHLRKKIDAEYGKYYTGWQTMYRNDPNAFREKTHEISTVSLLYRNLIECEDEYPMEVVAELCASGHPLQLLAQSFDRYDKKDFDSSVAEYLSENADEIPYLHIDHATLMKRLDDAIDRDYKEFCENRLGFDFSKFVRDAVHGDTADRLYEALRYHKDRFNADGLDALACRKQPMEHAIKQITSERILGADTPGMLKDVLPNLFPGLHAGEEHFEHRDMDLVMS